MMAASELDGQLERLARMHPRLCPRQVLGLRIGRLAGELLELPIPRDDKRLLVFAETDGCFADGVSVATGCWFGRRTMRLVDYGKVAATVADLESGRVVRIWPDPRARDLAERYAPEAPSRWHAQLLGYQVMPTAELLRAEPVTVRGSLSEIVGVPGIRADCARCGEEVLNQREMVLNGVAICRGCAGEPYYDQAGESG